MAYENGEETVQKMQTPFIIWVLQKQKSQLTKCCIKCLDNCKKSRQQTKCKDSQRLWRKSDLAAQLDKITMQILSRKSDLWAQQDKITMQRLWRKPDLWAQQAKIKLQRLWRKSSLWAQQDKIKMQRLWWKSGLWAQQEKITMQRLWWGWNLWTWKTRTKLPHMRSPWTPCWGRTKPYLYCLKKWLRNKLFRVPRMQYRDAQTTHWTTIHGRHVRVKLRWMAHKS